MNIPLFTSKNMKALISVTIIFICIFSSFTASGQEDRFSIIEQRLKDLSATVPGLNQKAELSVSGSSLQEFLRGLASTHNLNLNISPLLSQRVTNYFSNEKVINVLLYTAKQYNLDLNFVGSIISVNPYNDPSANLPPKPKELNIKYNALSETLTLDLSEDSILNVAKKITQASNKNIIVLPDLFNKKISGYIQELSVQGALEKLAISNSFKLNKTSDNTYILEPLKADEELITKPNQLSNSNYIIRKVNKNSNQSNSIQAFNNPNGQKLITLNVTNTPIKEIIKNIAEQMGVNYFIYTELEGNINANITDMDFDKTLGFVLQGTNYTYTNDKGVYLIGDRKNEGLRSYKLIQLKYRSVDSLFAILPVELTKGVDVKEFVELNSFLLSGSLPQIKEIEAFVNQIDRIVPMITIEVILLDVKKGKSIKTGIKMGVADSVKTGGSLLGGLDFTFGAGDINNFINRIGLNNVFNIGRVTPNFYASISALENNNNIELRQTPKLSTLNGHPASLSIGSTRYYSVTTQNVLGSLNPQTVVTQQFFPVEANLSIDILPIVSGDNQVTLNIGVNISDFVGTTPINQPPPSSNSKFKSIIRVKNEEMIILGGIERNEKSEEGSGTPFLSRIPVLKWFFSSRSKTNSKVVSVVFIKPTIVY
jgi:type IV pilus assembly protein PilQ